MIDSFGREIMYLRVSVTDHCNYKCFYCREEDDSAGSIRENLLSNSELTRIIRIFTELGVTKIRLTGGEPLVRKNIVDLIESVGAIDLITDFSMSTNGHLLAKNSEKIYKAGLTRLNISIDSLEEKSFAKITRGGDLNIVLDGISTAIKVGFKPIKINMVVMQGTNEHEIENMLDYAVANNLQLRYIETMPIGKSGIEAFCQHYPSDKILGRIRAYLKTDLELLENKKTAGPATIYSINNSGATVGVISAVSQHFCETCNRVRLTSTGQLVLCLGQENSISLKDAIRDLKTDEEIKSMILEAINKKPEKHDFNENKFNIVNQTMVSLGG